MLLPSQGFCGDQQAWRRANMETRRPYLEAGKYSMLVYAQSWQAGPYVGSQL